MNDDPSGYKRKREDTQSQQNPFLPSIFGSSPSNSPPNKRLQLPKPEVQTFDAPSTFNIGAYSPKQHSLSPPQRPHAKLGIGSSSPLMVLEQRTQSQQLSFPQPIEPSVTLDPTPNMRDLFPRNFLKQESFPSRPSGIGFGEGSMQVQEYRAFSSPIEEPLRFISPSTLKPPPKISSPFNIDSLLNPEPKVHSSQLSPPSIPFLPMQAPSNPQGQLSLVMPSLSPSPFLSLPSSSNQGSSNKGIDLQPKTPFDFSKLDLHASVNEAGLWQMTGERLESVSNQVSPYVNANSSKVTSEMIRIGSVTGSNELWGNSADENVRTEFLRSKHGSMTKQEAESSFNQRSHQGALIWATGSKSLTQYGEEGDLSEPISGHTPGVKNQAVPGTKGAMTKEHGRRDILRMGIVEKTLDDSSRKPHDLPIMSKLATIQLFMAPKEELMQQRSEVVNSPHDIFSQFKDIGKVSGGDGSSFEKLTDRVQIVRETEKMHAAKNLLISGYRDLVPQSHIDLLEQSKGDVGGAMNLLHAHSIDKQTTFKFNDAPESQTDRLDSGSLREHATKTVGRPRALSDPRRIAQPNFKF